MEIPKTQYARSGELAIAYQVSGEGGVDILYSGGPASNVETAWMLPGTAQFVERLGRFARVIRFDRRDSGCSDPYLADLTLEAHVSDALAVMDAVGAERPVLLGSSDGARSLASLAATHPDRAAALIALGTSARGLAVTSPELAAQITRRLDDLDWPGDTIATWAPGWMDDPVSCDLLTRYIRTSATPRQAARLVRLSLTSDVTDVLPLVQAPTLVLFPHDALMPPEAAARDFAARIPGAEFREIPGDAILLYAADPDVLAGAIEEFVTGTAPAPVTSRVLATVLFTDVVGSTERAAASGDRSWSALLARHLAAASGTIAAHDGETIKTTGDGVLALFTGPAQGVRCAQRIVADARHLGLPIRTGLHTGEVERVGDDVAGLAVHLAARIMGAADGGNVLVSRTVRDLVIGSELAFEDRGEHALKGFAEPWALYAAT